MSLVVAKFGGTSLGSIERIQVISQLVSSTYRAGYQVVVVVSAMAGETDKLFELGQSVCDKPNPREMDVLVSTGEQVSIALVAMAIQNHGIASRSFLGSQVPILTDEHHSRARIEQVGTKHLMESVNRGEIPVVAGFQGLCSDGDVTTIGRGGSDTSAVAVAVALDAAECRIYTDVDGVYTADPRIVENANRIDCISFEEMLELASLGAKVLHLRCVEYARRHSMRLKVLSSFEEGPGTLIIEEGEESMEKPEVSAITYDKKEAKITVMRVQDVPGIAFKLLGPIADAGISVDMIVQNASSENLTDLTFTVQRIDYEKSLEIVDNSIQELKTETTEEQDLPMEVMGDDTIAKVTAVGLGMRSHAGVARKMFETLASYGINIQMISTSEIKISVVIHEDFCELAVRVLHAAFGLETE